MTYEEAIKHGREQLEIFGGEHREFIKTALVALDRRIPMKPEIYCPLCSRRFNFLGEAECCPNCGQKIDWSVEEQ